MKHSISLLVAAVALAATSTVFGQVSDDAAYGGTGFIRKPTPSASPGAAATAAVPGKPLEANLSKSEKGKGDTTTFATSDKTIYLLWSDGTLKKGDKVRAVWMFESGGKNKKLTESSKVVPGPLSGSSFILGASSSGFPVGKYRAELFINSKLAKTLNFAVK